MSQKDAIWRRILQIWALIDVILAQFQSGFTYHFIKIGNNQV